MINNSNNPFFVNMDNISENIGIVENISLRNLNIEGNSANNCSANLSGMVLIIYNADNLLVENFNINDCVRNTFNIYNTSNSMFRNINITNLCMQSTTYTLGGNYAFSIENYKNYYRTAKNNTFENIYIDTFSCGAFHFYRTKFVSCSNIKIANGVNTYGVCIPVTFTESEHCMMDNLNIENCMGHSIEVNQSSRFIEINNSSVNSIDDRAIIFGCNISGDYQNDKITFNNCTFNTSNDYCMSVEYTKNVFFNSCIFDKSIGGSTKIEDIVFTNCKFTNFDFTKFYAKNNTTIFNSIINENIFAKELRLGNNKLKYSFTLEAQSSIDISLPFLLGEHHGLILLNSYFKDSPNQNYSALYMYSRSTNTSDLGVLSSIISSNGVDYRKITPATNSKKGLTITTVSTTKLYCTIEFI